MEKQMSHEDFMRAATIREIEKQSERICNKLDLVKQADLVNQPAHYARFKIEPITFIMQNDLPFYKGNCLKYVCRAGHKQYEGMTLLESEKKDIEKMIRYGQMRINQIDGKEEL